MTLSSFEYSYTLKVISEGGLSYREVNIMKRWITNSEREERRLNFITKEINIEEESKDRGKGYIKEER